MAVLVVGVLAVALIQPSLATARRQSKFSVCLDRLATISAATAMYSAEDPTDMALPVHPRQYMQDPGNPSHIGAYEWGGKAGVGQPGWTPGAGGAAFFLTSRYGTKAAFGAGSRPLNDILYSHGFADYGPPDYNADGAIADTRLQLDAYRCPADDGPPAGGHCIEWSENPDLTAYDYFGTSYHANVFMTSWVGGGPIWSNSPYLGPVARVIDPARTLAYNEAIGRWAWNAKRTHSGCSRVLGDDGMDPGPTKAIRGWHGKNWTFNRSFVDGHVASQKVFIEGTKDTYGYFEHFREELAFPNDPNEQARTVCIIIRGDGWQIDTLPAQPIPVSLYWDGSGRVSECRLPR